MATVSSEHLRNLRESWLFDAEHEAVKIRILAEYPSYNDLCIFCGTLDGCSCPDIVKSKK